MRRSFYVRATYIASIVAGAAILAWAAAGAFTYYQYHNASPCRGGAHHSCLLPIAGTVTGQEIAGHNNNLDIRTVNATETVKILGNIHSVSIGERVTIQEWNGTPVFVDTEHGRYDTQTYPERALLGLVGLVLISPSVLFIPGSERVRQALLRKILVHPGWSQ